MRFSLGITPKEQVFGLDAAEAGIAADSVNSVRCSRDPGELCRDFSPLNPA
jgi:hypothetical protein